MNTKYTVNNRFWNRKIRVNNTKVIVNWDLTSLYLSKYTNNIPRRRQILATLVVKAENLTNTKNVGKKSVRVNI
jgi:hypothetical protein